MTLSLGFVTSLLQVRHQFGTSTCYIGSGRRCSIIRGNIYYKGDCMFITRVKGCTINVVELFSKWSFVIEQTGFSPLISEKFYHAKEDALLAAIEKVKHGYKQQDRITKSNRTSPLGASSIKRHFILYHG